MGIIKFLHFYCSFPVDCGIIAVIGGTVTLTGTTLGSTATYSCDTGLILVGVETRTCQADATWSDEPPTCDSPGIANYKCLVE